MRDSAHLIAIVGGVALAAAGCGTGPDGKGDTVHYQFALAAFGGDTTAERARSYDCIVTGSFQLSSPVPVSGTAHFPITVTRRLGEQRGAHSETTSATLGAGPYVVALGPGAGVPTQQGEYAGPWSCDVGVPLARDSTLSAYGYDPTLEIPGTWRISPHSRTPRPASRARRNCS